MQDWKRNVPVVFLRDISLLLELEGFVDDHLLTLSSSVRLRPSSFSRIVLSLKVPVALRPAESEDLGVVSDELDPVSRVNTTRAVPALLNTHPEFF